MFCRYCGAHITDDSLFCSKCGRRLEPRSHPRLEKIVKVLRLKTPYPYFLILLGLFVMWAAGPRQSHADYSKIKWTLEMDGKVERLEENEFRHLPSLVVENTGTETVSEIPIELGAIVDPAQPAEILSDFLGRKLLIMKSGRPLPLVLVLSDKIAPGEKKRYPFLSVVSGKPPFKVTYEIREEDSHRLLTSVVAETH